MATEMGIRLLRLEARKLGVPNFRGMGERELKDAIAAANGSKGKTAGRKAVKKAAVKKAPAKRGRPAKAKPAAKAAPAPRRGRPPKAKPAPAPKRAKRQASAPRAQTTRKQTQRVEEPTGRHVLNGVDFSIESDDWNPRENSLTGIIYKALRRFKGNRDKVYAFLSPQVKELLGAKKRTGEKWAAGERETMLDYRISRTAWDYAVKTGQHDPATERVEYGTGGTGQGIWKPAKKKAAVKAPKTAPARRGRKPAAKATKPAARRTAAQKATPATRRKRTTGRRR
jgi:hypothetical protein